MKQGEQTGFTVIEVILFLSISALLLIVALTFSANAIRNARFSDATKSLESFLQEQFTRVQTNGITLNISSDNEPVCSESGDVSTSVVAEVSRGVSNCLLLGLALDVQDDQKTVNITPVVGSSTVNIPQTATDIQALALANPRVWSGGGQDVFTLPWTTTFTATKAMLMVSQSSPVETADIKRILFIRGIRSGVINMYASKTTTESVRDVVEGAGANAATTESKNVPTLLCISANDVSGLRGVVQITGNGESQGTNIGNISSSISEVTDLHFADANSNSAGVQCL